MNRLCKAFCSSLSGLNAAYRDETAFRQEVWLLLLALIVLFFLPLAWPWRLALLAGHLLLCLTELLNSSVEAVVDLVSPEKHPLAKKAKDCGSAAVLVACLLLFGGWLTALLSLGA